MADFIGEDETETFEGWLKYQAVDASLLAPDELAMWRGMYDEIRPSTPVGLIKFKPLVPNEYRYAIALRDGPDLWLTTWVLRSPKGDVYVFMPRSDTAWDAHTSYHRDGTMHSKSFGQAFFRKQRQPLTAAFKGTEHLGMHAGHAPKRLGAICDPAAFTDVVEFPSGVLGPLHGAVVVDLIEPGCEPMTLLQDHVIRKDFDHAFPTLVIRICPTPLPQQA
jgi:hypothetical protein